MLSLIEAVTERDNHLHLICILVSSWIKMFRSITFLMTSEWEITRLTLVKRTCISLHACLISCVQLLTWLRSVILFCSMFRWTCSELVYVSVFKVSMSIENMLYTLHATYIKHDLYADFSLKSEKLLKENFLWQIHSSRETRSLTAQISTVYFLSMSCRHFICNMYAYCSRFLL